MLNLQTTTLEQQERLFRNQIRLGLREILNEELQFYNQAFHSIANSSSVLAGFAFVGLQMDEYHERHPRTRLLFNTLSALAMSICLLTAVFANFAGLFSTRLALRGGSNAVEEAVGTVRGEYKICLLMLVTGIETFIVSIPFLSYYKFDDLTATIITTTISFPIFCLVIYSYRRAENKFFLSKSDRFGSTRRGTGGPKDVQAPAFDDNQTLQNLVHDVDRRNFVFTKPSERAPAGRKVRTRSRSQGAVPRADKPPEEAVIGPQFPQSEEKDSSSSSIKFHSERPARRRFWG